MFIAATAICFEVIAAHIRRALERHVHHLDPGGALEHEHQEVVVRAHTAARRVSDDHRDRALGIRRGRGLGNERKHKGNEQLHRPSSRRKC
jgi:hypothetical protein